ncbi:MAG: cation:proton antiporter [Candidatus Spyradenecus sp.]
MDSATLFFADLSIVIAVAAAVGLIFSRFRLPLTVGYILAGVVAGPHAGPTLIQNEQNIRMLSDLGVMFLMFSIGLGFSFRKVRQMGAGVVFPAIWDVCFMVLGGFCLGKALGWGNLEGFLLGLILCDSSTSIAAKTLESLGWLGRRFSDSTFAIALIEDILAILLIAVLGGVGGGAEGSAWATALTVARQVGILLLFLVGAIVFGLLLVPRLMNWVAERFDDELVLLAALGVCFAISCLAQNALGLSLVVGAFLAGAVVAEARSRRRIERIVHPVTNLFAAVFFVSVGLQLDPRALWANAGVILLITGVMILLKAVNNTVACTLVGERPRDAFKVGLGMGQVAEFSFIIAALAMAQGLSQRPLYQIAIGVALLCTATNPYLLRGSDRLYNGLARCFGPRARETFHWYRRWLTALSARRTESGSSLAAHLRGHAIFLGIDLACCAILFAGVHALSRLAPVATFLAQLDDALPWPGFPAGRLLCCLGALLLTTPIFWAAWHTWGEIARHVAEDAFAGEVGGLTRVRRFIRTILRAVGWAGLIVYAAILCSGFVANLLLLAPLVLFALAFATRHSKRLRAEYNASHHLLSQAFDLNALPPEDPVTLGAILAVHTETFLLPRESAAVGKTLGELNLRGTTGAAVISVTARDGKLNVSPGRDTRLAAGDSLVLVGSDPELARATALLAQRGV